MIEFNYIESYGWDAALRGVRNPKESWEKGDSKEYIYLNANNYPPYSFDEKEHKVIKRIDNHAICIKIGPNDLKLCRALTKSGTDHAKFARQIGVSMDITAPLYWFKEFDQYKIGTVSNSESTMHKLAETPITRACFSFDRMDDTFALVDDWFEDYIQDCEKLRKFYLETQDVRYWRALIQLLPSGWMQTRTVTLNYQVLRNIYFARKTHKLEEWHNFCEMIEKLPYSEELITVQRG